MSIEKDSLDQAVRDVIAGQILAQLSSEHRAAILERAMAESLKSYDFRHEVAQAACKVAREVATTLFEEPAWRMRVEAVIRDAMDEYLGQLKAASVEAFRKVFHGGDTGNGFAKAGSVLEFWPKPKAE